MIIVDDVFKRYQTNHGPSKWILEGASFVIPAKTNVGLVGGNGAGKSTLLRIIGGVDQPTKGRVERHCSVSWPMGFSGGLQGSLTGRQNAKFICRIHGHEDDIPERLAFIQEFAEIGDAFDEPTKTYSSGMGARLKFAISLAFDFDVYISDELTAVGDAAFKNKAKQAFQNLIDRAGLIMVSHGESTLKEFCKAGVWLHEGRAHWFDDINDALQAYRGSQKIVQPVTGSAEQPQYQGNELLRNKASQLSGLQRAIHVLHQGINGQPVTTDEETANRIIHQAKRVGMVLLPEETIAQQGYRLKEGTIPLLKSISSQIPDTTIDLYDLNSQCVKVDNNDNDSATPK